MVVYLTINLINGKKYIGKDSNNNPSYLGSGVYLKKAIEKYGKENFKKIILEKVEDISQLNEREEFWIKKFKADKSLEFYNISEKGKGFPKGLKSILQTQSKWKPIIQYDLQGNFIKEWGSIKEICSFLKLDRSNLSKNINGKTKQYKGFVWKPKHL